MYNNYPMFNNNPYGHMPNQNFNPYQMQQMQNNNANSNNGIKGRAVTGYDEAKAAMIDLDGSLHVFTDVANNKIYTKQIMLDGTAQIRTYIYNEGNNQNDTISKPVKQVIQRDYEEDIEILKSDIKMLKNDIRTLKEDIHNESNADNAISRANKKQ